MKFEGVPIELDRVRHLRYDFNALSILEERTDFSFLGGEGQWIPKSISEITFFVWAGLIWDDPELTEEQVGHMLDTSNITEVLEAVNKAIGGETPSPLPDSNSQPLTNLESPKSSSES
jgi:hypothetical protein